jgi:hypothetical protein
MIGVTIDQTITARINAVKDRAGNDVEVDAAGWTWESDSDTVILTPSADTKSCLIDPQNVDDTVSLKATADSDTTPDGVIPLVAIFDTLVVKGGRAVFVEAAFDAPVDRTA